MTCFIKQQNDAVDLTVSMIENRKVEATSLRQTTTISLTIVRWIATERISYKGWGSATTVLGVGCLDCLKVVWGYGGERLQHMGGENSLLKLASLARATPAP